MRIILLILVAIASPISNAGIWATTGGTIESIQSESNFIIIRIAGQPLNLADGCDTPNDVVLEDDTKTGDRQMSMLLAAHMSGKPVSIYTSGCKVAWGKKYPVIWSVKIQN